MLFNNRPPFDTQLDIPLYKQLYTHLRQAILTGKLKRTTKLPSTRALADELNISRNTVQAAFNQLLAEGYIESVRGSGTFVARVLPEALLAAPLQPVTPESRMEADRAGQVRLARTAQRQLAEAQLRAESPSAGRSAWLPFRPELAALDRFPFEIWARLTIRRARRSGRAELAYQEPAGYQPLREAIASHINLARGVECTPDQILIVSGSQAGLDLTVRVLLDPNDPVWLEDPGYPGARGAFLGAGAQLVPVPVDQHGLNVQAGMARAPHARLVYTTPAHQFPLGVTLSLERRLALLDWAKREEAYIIEDDYDSEFRFAGRPLAALKGLDDAGRVIYIGTFSKVLFPALRLGYLVLPPRLVEPFLAVRKLIDLHSPPFEQGVLTDFIAGGHFARHLRRMRHLYARRRAAFLEGARALPLEIESPPAGIHCVGWLPKGMDEQAVVTAAAARELVLAPLSDYRLEPGPRPGLLLGYGGYDVQEIRSGLHRLGAVLQAL